VLPPSFKHLACVREDVTSLFCNNKLCTHNTRYCNKYPLSIFDNVNYVIVICFRYFFTPDMCVMSTWWVKRSWAIWWWYRWPNFVEWLCASTWLSEVLRTRTSVGGPNTLGGSVTKRTQSFSTKPQEKGKGETKNTKLQKFQQRCKNKTKKWSKPVGHTCGHSLDLTWRTQSQSKYKIIVDPWLKLE
jgi:hypothetical protein